MEFTFEIPYCLPEWSSRLQQRNDGSLFTDGDCPRKVAVSETCFLMLGVRNVGIDSSKFWFQSVMLDREEHRSDLSKTHFISKSDLFNSLYSVSGHSHKISHANLAVTYHTLMQRTFSELEESIAAVLYRLEKNLVCAVFVPEERIQLASSVGQIRSVQDFFDQRCCVCSKSQQDECSRLTERSVFHPMFSSKPKLPDRQSFNTITVFLPPRQMVGLCIFKGRCHIVADLDQYSYLLDSGRQFKILQYY